MDSHKEAVHLFDLPDYNWDEVSQEVIDRIRALERVAYWTVKEEE